MRCLTSVGSRTRSGAFDRRARCSWPIAKYWEYGSLEASDRCAGLFSDKASKTGFWRTSPDGTLPPFSGLTRVAAARTGARALFGNIGSQPRASSACKRCSGELLSPVLGRLGRQVYIFHNDLDDLVGVVLGR